jgi:NTE family protein
MACGLAGVGGSDCARRPRGGIINPAGLRRILTDAVPFERIDGLLRDGHLRAVSVSATHVGTGKAVVFVQQSHDMLPSWGNDTTVEPRAAALGVDHALASAAIPFLFPAVSIDGELYCDGALRQNVPLSPARRLGSDALIVVSPNCSPDSPTDPELARERERSFFGPAFLAGKTMNALLLDRVDGDVDRLNRINQILEAGVREYGPGFLAAINRQLGRDGLARLRPLESIVIRPSQNIGLLAGEFLASAGFRRRASMTRRLFRRFAATSREADFGSYLLFDGRFAAELIELGRADARAHHERLARLFDSVLSQDDQATAA